LETVIDLRTLVRCKLASQCRYVEHVTMCTLYNYTTCTNMYTSMHWVRILYGCAR